MKMKIAFLLFIFSIELLSQNIEQSSNESDAVVIITDIAFIVPAFVTFIGFHELGHYSMAKLFGAQNARFGLFRKKPDGGVQIGWTKVDDNLSSFGNSMLYIGGVLFSRGMAEAANIGVDSQIFPKAINRFLSITYLMGRFDFPRYVLQDALINLGDGKGSDMDGFVTEIAGDQTGLRTITYLSLLGISIFDLVLDWDNIEKHWSIITGKSYPDSKEESGSFRNFSLYSDYGKTLGVSFQLNF